MPSGSFLFQSMRMAPACTCSMLHVACDTHFNTCCACPCPAPYLAPSPGHGPCLSPALCLSPVPAPGSPVPDRRPAPVPDRAGARPPAAAAGRAAGAPVGARGAAHPELLLPLLLRLRRRALGLAAPLQEHEGHINISACVSRGDHQAMEVKMSQRVQAG